MAFPQINSTEYEGNLVKQPEIKLYGPEQKHKCDFALAHHTGRKVGQYDETQFMNVTAFGFIADFVAKYASRGETLIVWGYLNKSRWKDKSNQQHENVSIVANKVRIVATGKTAVARPEDIVNPDGQIDELPPPDDDPEAVDLSEEPF